MHANTAVILGCTDCHGGDASIKRPAAAQPADSASRQARSRARAAAAAEDWDYPASATPRTYTLLNSEAPEFVRFINPGDYRVAREACGACHLPIIQAAERSLMATSAMLWGGAAYNNGILPFKRYMLGEAYTTKGEAASIKNPIAPDSEHDREGHPAAAISAAGVGDGAARRRLPRVRARRQVIASQFPEIGLPNWPGRCSCSTSRGAPTSTRVEPRPGHRQPHRRAVINIARRGSTTRTCGSSAPTSSPGDYRSSGCSGCHVRVRERSRPAAFGALCEVSATSARSQTLDPTIPQERARAIR